jgi:hypothetical protein
LAISASLAPLRLERGGKFVPIARADNQPHRVEARGNSGLCNNLANVGGDALACGRRHAMLAKYPNKAIES